MIHTLLRRGEDPQPEVFAPDNVRSIWKAIASSVVTAAIVGFGTAWAGDHLATAMTRERLDRAETTLTQVKQQMETMPLGPEIATRRDLDGRFDSIQLQLKTIEGQLIEIRGYVMARQQGGR